MTRDKAQTGERQKVEVRLWVFSVSGVPGVREESPFSD